MSILKKNIFFIALIIIGVLFFYTKKRTLSSVAIISVAASLGDGTKEIADKYYKETGNKVILNFGGSGTLRKAVENGAPVDAVILASDLDVEKLIKKKLVEKKIKILKNKLVVLSKNKITNLKEIDSLVALGDPNFVPAGKYAKESLISLGLWRSISQNMILTKDVRSALTYARSKQVDFAFVYKTDAIIAKDLNFYEIPENLYSKIIYSMGAINNSSKGNQFLKYFKNNIKIFNKYGFEEYK